MNHEQKKLLTKRFQTTMIGSLFEFENTFGYLWGHDKEMDQLTEREQEFSDMWEDVRNRILNNGNSQLRKTISDFDKLPSAEHRYSYKFYTRGDNK